MIIALLGNDGSGKTTNRHIINHELRALGISIKIIQGFDHFLLQFCKDLISRILGAKMDTLQRNYSSGASTLTNSKIKTLLFTLWPFLVFFDCILIYLRTARNPDTLVIFDRYFYDHALSFEELGYSSRLIRKLFFLLPQPDVGFVFDADAHIAYSRKKHNHAANFDYYLRQREQYLKLARRKGLPVIDTSHLSPRESVNRVLDSLSKHHRFRQLIFRAKRLPQTTRP